MRRLLASALAAVVIAAVGGCADAPEVQPTDWVGDNSHTTTLLLDAGSTPVLSTIAVYADAHGGNRVHYGVGPAQGVANAVKDGQTVDAVLLPAGRDLDRLRGEFVFPAEQVATIDGTAYWIGVVTMRGWGLLEFLTGRQGRRELVAHGVQLPPPLP